MCSQNFVLIWKGFDQKTVFRSLPFYYIWTQFGGQIASKLRIKNSILIFFLQKIHHKIKLFLHLYICVDCRKKIWYYMGQPTKAAVFFQCHFWVHAYYKKISYSHLGGKQGDYVARKKWAFFGIMCKHSKLLWSAIYCMLSCSHITKMAPAGPVSTMFDFDNFALTIFIFFQTVECNL